MKKITLFFALLLFFAPINSEAITLSQLERINELKKEATELLKKKDFDRAIPVLNEILSIDPLEKTANRYLNIARQQPIEPFCEEAAEAFMNDDYAKAIGTWEKILQLDPDDYRFSRLIEMTKNLISNKTIKDMYANAEKFLEQGDRKSAINELEKILSINSYDRRAREMLVNAKQSAYDKKTKKHYEQAEVYIKQKKYALAIEEWKKILEIDDTQEAAKRLIASAIRENIKSKYIEAKKLYEKGDYLTSRDMFYKILVDNPTDTEVKKIISTLDETIKVVNRLDGKDKASVMMRKSMKNHIDINGNKKAAVAASWYAMQLDPTNTNALAIKNLMERKYVSILITMDSPIGDMNVIDQYLFAALNHIYEGRYDRSIQESHIVIELQSDNVLAWKRLGSAYFAMGNKDKARNAWKTALKIAPKDAELKQFIKQTK